MKKLCIALLAILGLGWAALPCRADGFAGPGDCGCSSCAPACEVSCCPTEGGCHKHLLTKLHGLLHHAHGCCETECCAPPVTCCNPCPCEAAPKHSLLGCLHHCKSSPCDCPAPCDTCDTCGSKHHIFGFLHHQHGCAAPCDCGAPACSSCGQ